MNSKITDSLTTDKTKEYIIIEGDVEVTEDVSRETQFFCNNIWASLSYGAPPISEWKDCVILTDDINKLLIRCTYGPYADENSVFELYFQDWNMSDDTFYKPYESEKCQ